MPDSALYFPYMEVPETDSIWAVLLYWDRLGAITPRAVHGRLSTWTRRLIDAGLVEPITPMQHIARDFSCGFLDLVDALPSQWAPSAPVFIHVEKGEHRLWRDLKQRGLANFPRRDGTPLMAAVEGRVGRLYMAYLATYLSQRPELDMEPITDQPRYFEALGDPLTMATARELDRIRSIVVRDVLPCPHGHVDPADLAKFKEQHRDLLLPFRRQVEDCVLRCAMYDDREMRRRTAREAAAGFRDQADEIERRLAERRWPTRMGSFCALLGGLPASIGGLVTGHPEIAVAAASAPLVAEFVRHRFDGCDALPSTAYAVLAREAFP